MERLESGLLSFGGDTDDDTNPFEVRLDRYMDLGLGDDMIGIWALRLIRDEGPRRHQLDDETPQAGHAVRYDVFAEGERIDSMTNGG